MRDREALVAPAPAADNLAVAVAIDASSRVTDLHDQRAAPRSFRVPHFETVLDKHIAKYCAMMHFAEARSRQLLSLVNPYLRGYFCREIDFAKLRVRFPLPAHLHVDPRPNVEDPLRARSPRVSAGVG